MLVWSEAWSAKGEKGETDCCLKHTPTQACVPTAFPVSPGPTACKWNQRNDFDRNDALEKPPGPRLKGRAILCDITFAAWGLESTNAYSQR